MNERYTPAGQGNRICPYVAHPPRAGSSEIPKADLVDSQLVVSSRTFFVKCDGPPLSAFADIFRVFPEVSGVYSAETVVPVGKSWKDCLLTETPPQADVRRSMLLMQTSQFRCALATMDVVEVMRPLPVSPMPGVPAFVSGVAVIRGLSVPVVDLGMLLGAAALASAGWWVVLRLGEQRVALAVEAVRGVVQLDGSTLASAPPLLRDARAEFIETMGVMDQQLYLTLNSGRILGDEVWLALATQAASS